MTLFRLDYTQPIPVPDMQAVEQTLNMSPMDLFDSIFWGWLSIDSLSKDRMTDES